MKRAYIALLSAFNDAPCVLLAQTNIYLPPHQRFSFATIARNAMQFVLPHCLVKGDSDIEAQLLQEVELSLGLKLSPGKLHVLAQNKDFAAYATQLPPNFDLTPINAGFETMSFGSARFHQAGFYRLEDAFSQLGNKEQFHSEGWVLTQTERAIAAGFSEQFINQRVNTPHEIFVWILAKLIASNFLDSAERSLTNVLDSASDKKGS